MIIFLSELQREHLKILQDNSEQVLVDFCKLSIDYINNGLNQKKCTIAAEKLSCSKKEIENVLNALVYLLVDGCKHNISEVDFKSSLALAGFEPVHQDILTKLYSTKATEISECLYLMQPRDSTYQDLAWRLEVEVNSYLHSACTVQSKSGNDELKPTVTLDLILAKTKTVSERENTNNLGYHKSQSSHILPSNFSIETAQTASQCQNVTSHFLLQCDLPNLLNMTHKLEQALKESKSQHVRKVQRALT